MSSGIVVAARHLELGEAPQLKGFFVGAGFNSMGIASSGGAGMALAEWIVAGHPTMDLTEVDVSRTGRWATQRGLQRTDGHAAGEEALADTVEGSVEVGLKWLTVYAFSSEN